jgi:hypothetical protein
MIIKAPYIPKPKNWEKVEDFRKAYPRAQNIPVEIEGIASSDLKIDIIPEPGLKSLYDIDAYITRDFKSIVVDRDHYMDDKYYPRVRFSMAHEIGHFILHKDFFLRNSFGDSTENWLDFMRQMPEREYAFLENHANEFAGVLLVPANELISSLTPGKTFHDIARFFQVSAEVIKKRVVNDDVAPHLQK